MFQKFMLKAMLGKQLKGLPPETQDKIINAVSENPEFFTKLAESIQGKMKAGKSQMDATMEAVRDHQEELRKLLQ